MPPDVRPFLSALLLVQFLAGCSTSPSEPPTTSSSTPAVPLKRDAIRFDTENGSFIVLLYPEAAPKTVDLMKTYVAERYYVNREFNRVVPGHVIQLVDKAGGATDDARRVPLETSPTYHFSAGAVGIARSQDPNSGGPEFFVMDFATSHLDGNYTVWGQVVTGLGVVHTIARVPAVETGKIPVAGGQFMDRMAIDATAITGTQLVSLEYSPGQAAQFPFVVAKNHREGDYRHSLDWPRSIAPGQPSNLTWYIRPYNGTTVPAADDARIRIGDESLPVRGEAGVPGIYHWTWSPPRAGEHNATFVVASNTLATLRLLVLPPLE